MARLRLMSPTFAAAILAAAPVAHADKIVVKYRIGARGIELA